MNNCFNLNSEVEMTNNPRNPVIAASHKAVLKHTQSKRWREIQCGHANAERLDCVRFIATFPASAR